MAKVDGPAVGIDLGTTYSCVGVWQHDRYVHFGPFLPPRKKARFRRHEIASARAHVDRAASRDRRDERALSTSRRPPFDVSFASISPPARRHRPGDRTNSDVAATIIGVAKTQTRFDPTVETKPVTHAAPRLLRPASPERTRSSDPPGFFSVEIIANDQGNRTTPSYVAFTDSERLIGDAAKNQTAMNPKNTVFDAKRLIGRKFSDPEVQADIKDWSFKVKSKDGEKPMIVVEYQGEEKEFSPRRSP